MNVTGVSPAMSAANNISFASTASIKVMKLAENAMEDTMSTLLASMDTMISGLGQNIDTTV